MAEHRTKDILKGLGTIAGVIALLFGMMWVLYVLFMVV